MRKFRIEETMIYCFIIGEQQEAFAVEIQAANGIQVMRHPEKIF